MIVVDFLLDLVFIMFLLITLTVLGYVLIVRIWSIVGIISERPNWANRIWKSWF